MKFLSLALVVAAPFAARADFEAAVATVRQGSAVEFCVVYSDFPDLTAAESIDFYHVESASAVVESVRYVVNSKACLVTVSGLEPDDFYEFSILGVPNANLTESVYRSYRVQPPEASAVVIGAGELGFQSEGVAIGQGAYELVSGAFEFSGVYDEATFVYQTAKGDFDKVVRVESQDNGSAYARAGLMVRESADELKPRPGDEGDPAQAFSRFVNLYVSPDSGIDGTTGSPYAASDTRLFTGGIGRTDTDPTKTVIFDASPARVYPQAWLRLKRVGEVFQTFTGTDGTNWVKLSETTFPTKDVNDVVLPAFANEALVGMFYSADNGNIPFAGGDRGSYKARFAEFGDFAIGGQPPRPALLSARRSGDSVVVSWSNGGTLWTAPTVAGPWTALSGKSPQILDRVPEGRLFKVLNP